MKNIINYFSYTFASNSLSFFVFVFFFCQSPCKNEVFFQKTIPFKKFLNAKFVLSFLKLNEEELALAVHYIVDCNSPFKSNLPFKDLPFKSNTYTTQW